MTACKDKLTSRLAPVMIFLLAVAAFFPVLQNGFVNWDDDVNILRNVNYRGLGWQQLRWMFTDLGMGHYQPLSWLTLGVDYLLWGMNPFGYHLTNLLLHGANAVIFYFVALRLLAAAFREPMTGRELSLRIAAGFAALLFAIHPLRVESVAWVTERRGLLAALFLLWSVICYLRAAGAIPERSSAYLRWMSAAVTLFGLSLLSKASGLALPVVLLALDVYPLARLGGRVRSWAEVKNRRIFWEKAPFLVLALAAVAVAFVAEHQRGALRSLGQYGIFFRLAHAFFGLAFYLWKTFVPAGLFPMVAAVGDAVPAYWPFQPGDSATLALSIAAVLTASVILFLLRYRWPAGLAGWVCYVAILAPVLGIVRIGEQIAADRYSYLACLGAALLAGGGVIYLRRRWMGARPAASIALTAGLAAAVLFALGASTWKQTQVWRDSETLFRYVLAVSPGSKNAHNNLGMVLVRRDELDAAMAHFRLSLRVDPDFESPLYNLALALDAQGKVDEAIQHYRHFLRLDHTLVEFRLIAYHRLGILLAQQGKLDEAIAHYRKALALDPEFALAQTDLSAALAAKRGLEERERR